ncbi:ABC transporter substrate-binding protein [Cohnella sp.]|uniref:ABC transporter substrate-binding protein n=1 Tax=Cohnella sp. TaxID=1883426 RepID=UPI003704438C
MRKLSLVLAATLMAGALSACGSNGNTNDSSPAASGNGDTGKAKDVDLKVFVSLPRFKNQFEQYFEQFKKKELAEKNINVKISLEMPSADTADQILKSRMSGGDSPDVFTLHAVNDIPGFYRAGYLEDLSDQPFVGQLLEGVKSGVTFDDKVLAVPLESVGWGMLYNKKIFRENNLKLPETVTEMKQLADELKAKDIQPFMIALKESWMAESFPTLAVGALNSSANPGFVDRMNEGTASYAELKGLTDTMDMLRDYGGKKVFELDGDQATAEFAQGNIAMWPAQGPWFAEAILKNDPDFELGVAPMPINDDPKSTLLNLSTSTSIGVAPDSKNKEVALDLVNYILDQKDSSAFYQSMMFNPVAESHTFSPYPWIEDVTGYASAGKAYDDPRIPSGVKNVSETLFQGYYAKDMTAEQVVQAMDKAWKDANELNKQ